MSERKRFEFVKNNAHLVCTASCDGDVKFYPGEREALLDYPTKIAEGICDSVKAKEPAKELTAAEVMKLTEVRNANVAGK